uniref:Microsomal glutathione S-transferase 1 n=1 Tax=Helicotheca tamesis TaxID=374047 RepID=A0A7S2E0H8_9STRA|mmetsp:Transcript_11410/g.15810  ORF Transcript_11410/g.15810 Transcript_11410/m.15810 type:complete len:158 (+) Transcript_11410:174-647(+)|eukprot:CAMPEP_0185734346 /NCGR_PEP_ID=MMETSP1171-20130828/22216_1 /TAXON_ID=374046 /ORGANISM="Helicotheca tamensis, Strain CCMP826" /LENGTH=157 /DNA_ID=CAMNT_0028404317 /DNA_START=112 /DNA_END=585 /DNA_ORIENTATION=+
MPSDLAQAVRATAILSVLIWTKVVATNLGLGGAKKNAGGRPPEDTYQKKDDEVTGEDKDRMDRAQRIVNNDLENIPYTMVLAWGALFCISLIEDEGALNDHARAHIVLYSLFSACRFTHSIVYALGLAYVRSLVWLVGVLCSFGIAINGAAASYKIP